MKQIFTLGTIRDYILKYFPETLWWDGFNKHEVYNSERNYKHRAGMPNEIRIEFDSEDRESNWENINYTAIKLNELKLSFVIFYVEGGRSPHIHIYDLDELEDLDEKQRTEYRQRFLNKVCPKGSKPDLGLCDEKHLCALEFVNHFKYGKPKELLNYFWNGRKQGIDFNIKWDIQEKKREPTKEKKVVKEITLGDVLKNNVRQKVIENLSFEVVMDKYGLKYRGHMAKCPFHNDTNYSLSFSNEKGLWKCFGCQAKGDIISLIKMLKENKNE